MDAAFLVWRDERGLRRILRLTGARVTIGRGDACDVRLAWDERVSRAHAALERTGPAWTLLDDGLSRNGTFRNGERVTGRRRLADGDELTCGDTVIAFRAPGAASVARTLVETPIALSETQRRVLVALCRPFLDGAEFGTPATNRAIAAEVCLGVDAVKARLGALFAGFGLSALPPSQKRMRLAELALRSGAVTRRDLA